MKISVNTLETNFKHPWNTLETPLNHPWNTFEKPLKHLWHTLDTLLTHPWCTLETLLKCSWNTLETLLKHSWNTLETLLKPFKHLSYFGWSDAPKWKLYCGRTDGVLLSLLKLSIAAEYWEILRTTSRTKSKQPHYDGLRHHHN